MDTLYHDSIRDLTINFLLQFLFLSEASLRCLIRFLVNKNVQIPITDKDGKHKGILKGETSFNKFGKSLLIDFLNFDADSKSLFDLWIESRNTIHNFYRHHPFEGKNDKAIEYKGVKYNFYYNHPLTFLTNDFCCMMIEDIYNLMLDIFTHKKIDQYNHIPGLDPVYR